jgi:hypothetical protein
MSATCNGIASVCCSNWRWLQEDIAGNLFGIGDVTGDTQRAFGTVEAWGR